MNDLRFALRQLRKAPGFTLIAVITLALGIGANTAIFSVIYGVLLRPLPYPDGDRIMIVTETDASQPQISVSFPDYLDWKRDNTVFENIAVARRESFNLSGLEGRAPEQISGGLVTANFFKVLGLEPQLGRTFTEEEDRVGGPLLGVISDRLWQRLFERNPNVLGRTLNLGNQPYTVIGVMPPQMFSPRTVDVWFPLMRRTDDQMWQTRDNHPGLFGWARLKKDVTVEKALNELKQIAARLAKQYPDSNSAVSVTVTPLLENQVGDYRDSLNLLLGAVALVLLIACANLANLLAARGAARAREFAVRAAVGASRWQIIRQLLIESLVLALVGGALGLCMAAWGRDLLVTLSPAGSPRFKDLPLDGWVLSFSLALSLITNLLFGLWPAWHTSRADIQLALKSGGHGSSDSPGARRSRDLLVIAEVALTLVLLSAAGLVLKSFANARSLGLGFDPHLLLSARIDLPSPSYADAKKLLNFSAALMEKLSALPGVERVALASTPPLMTGWETSFVPEGAPEPEPGKMPSAEMNVVTPGYFRTLKTPLLRGRQFEAGDTKDVPPVLIIDQVFVDRYFPGHDPIGKRVRMSTGEKGEKEYRTIVGVVPHLKVYGFEETTVLPQAYLPMTQQPQTGLVALLRTSLSPKSLEKPVRDIVASLDPAQPAFEFKTMLTLALGIGANTAIFTVVHAVLLSPLPYPNADRLVAVQSRNFQENLKGQGFAPAGFRDVEKQVTSFEGIAAFRYNYDNLTGIEKPTSLTGSLVTQDYLKLLGEKPLIGRAFTKEDAAAGAKPTVVLSYDLWQKQFGGRREIVGEAITLNDVPHEVIGVMPRTFKDPFNISSLWRIFPNEGGENFVANARFWAAVGRLKAGVPASTVQAELSTIAARLAQSDPKFYKGWDFNVSPLRDQVVGNYREGLLLVVGASLLVLLITCANVAGLQFVRASTKQREVAIRLALGASRSAIVRSRLIESLLLVALGGIGGVLIGSWGLDLLLASLARDWIPRSDEIALSMPVLLLTGLTALLTGIVFGLFPAWHATRVEAIDSLRDGSKGSAGLQSVRLRGALVIAQIAFTLVLLVCAGLVWKSFAAINRVNPGIQVENTLSMVLTLSPTRYDTGPKRTDYYRQVLERIGAVPGVESVAFTQTMPFMWGIPATFSIYGLPDDTAKLPPAYYDSISPSYFASMHIPLLAGRTFADTDDARAPSVIVLSQSAAQKFFSTEDPIGKRLTLPPGRQETKPTVLEVIGIVGDVPRDGLNAVTPYQVYASLNQRGWPFATLLVRSPMPVESLSKTIQRAIWEFNPEQTISNVMPVRTLVKQTLTQPQLYLTLFSLFALLALLLAAIGLYGLIAYSVAQRTREFGIRYALGAQVRDVLRLVLGQGARLTALGLAIGVLAAAGVARLMETLLFRTTAYDPIVFGGVVFVLAVIGLLAALLPALRATKADPVAALRAE